MNRGGSVGTYSEIPDPRHPQHAPRPMPLYREGRESSAQHRWQASQGPALCQGAALRALSSPWAHRHLCPPSPTS